jgi:signal transduction histidine kinase
MRTKQSAERHIREAAECIRKQKELIARLTSGGRDTAPARELLALFEQSQRICLEVYEREEDVIRSEEVLRRESEASGDALQRMRDFIAVVSHELRNSLGPIRVAASLMAKRELDPSVEHLRQMIDRQSVLLTRIVGTESSAAIFRSRVSRFCLLMC